jgi:hypothetical protein
MSGLKAWIYLSSNGTSKCEYGDSGFARMTAPKTSDGNGNDNSKKQVLRLRRRMTTKKQRQRQKQIPPLRCGMTNKERRPNDKQESCGMTSKRTGENPSVYLFGLHQFVDEGFGDIGG